MLKSQFVWKTYLYIYPYLSSIFNSIWQKILPLESLNCSLSKQKKSPQIAGIYILAEQN